MRRILLSLALLTTVAVGAQAQGAGLSQGQAYVAPTTTQTKAKKTCPNCGITMGNITYPWQHESWCPYYRSSGGSSSSRSSSRSYGTYTAASAATTALGSLLSGLISSGFSRSTTPSPVRQEQAAKQKELMNKVHFHSSKYIQSMLADEQFWEVGDYAVVEGKQEYEGGKAYGIINKKTGKYVLDPNKTKHEKGDYALFRRLHLGKKIVKIDDKRFLRAQMRLLPPPEGDPSGKPFVYFQYIKKYDPEYSQPWRADGTEWFQITDDEKLQPLRGCFCIVERGGKMGLYDLYNRDDYSYNPISGYAESVKSTSFRSIILIPAIYDSIVDIGSAYRAKLGTDEFVFIYDDQDSLVKANAAMKQFDTLKAKHVEGDDIFHVAFYVASSKGKYGLVSPEGQIILPLIYNQEGNIPIDAYKAISYTSWYKQEAAKYIDKKGEYEKTEHFEARMKDAKMQEEYLREVMADAPQRYLKEKTKGGLKLSIGQYDADNECFPINVGIAPWNSFLLPVPITEAEAFKDAFSSIKAEAEKNAELGIRYDAPSVESITFTTSDGKTYRYEN